ncbi:response regulator transcription factor [Pseudomonadota bacterium AL_CKDN230030165-1A_HGKHYDSX7]
MPAPPRELRQDSPRATPAALREPGAAYTPLTPREREVLAYLSAGLPNKVIAIDLGISMRTAEAHRARILRKMGVRTAQQVGCITCPYRLGALAGSAQAAPMQTGPTQEAR